jgi:hypothetical protein
MNVWLRSFDLNACCDANTFDHAWDSDIAHLPADEFAYPVNEDTDPCATIKTLLFTGLYYMRMHFQLLTKDVAVIFSFKGVWQPSVTGLKSNQISR